MTWLRLSISSTRPRLQSAILTTFEEPKEKMSKRLKGCIRTMPHLWKENQNRVSIAKGAL